jgi:hypothetical protein
MPYLSMTRLKLNSPMYLPSFLVYNDKIVREVRTSSGFIKGKQLATPSLSMWTATLWDSSSSLKSFYQTGSHREVMNKIDEWSSEAVSAHKEVESYDLPSWQDIRIYLSKSGHFLNLKEASLNHQQRIIEEPKIAPITTLIFPL